MAFIKFSPNQNFTIPDNGISIGLNNELKFDEFLAVIKRTAVRRKKMSLSTLEITTTEKKNKVDNPNHAVLLY